VAAYCALAGWFLYTPYRVFFGGAGSDLGWVAGLMAVCSLFIGVFMVKAIFSVKNAKPTDLHEVTAKEEPRLFAFLFELADAAGAPRPHKVFLSARVNAAVFYDLSLFNLIFPSKKNLEIGLALVNTLTLGEFRAVLAHEFGHFAQRSMAVGRWVYVAQQIATHLVTRRDALDDFLVSLGNLDLRVRAVVAVVQLIIWSIRSLVESLFNAVILMQRALSREMEMQADLVAVSITGSDALIHALHRLQGADDAWERALHFVFGEQGSGRATRDVFAVQSHMLQRMSAILGDDAYANVPPLPAQDKDRHRIFKVELAQPPKMWLTHPLNHEREANAKRIYVPAAIDPASAWSVFEQPLLVREQMTATLLGEGDAKAVELEESLKTLARQFKREQFNRRYCGVYFSRSLARHVEKYEDLRDPGRASELGEMAAMYPASLMQDVQALRTLETEAGQIQALISGVMTAPGKVVLVRGVEFRKKQLPAALEKVQADIAAVAGRLQAHDKLCRSWHQSRAARLEGGWQAYLDGLLALIHYAEHTAANVLDAQGMLNNTTAVVTALRKVSEDGVSRVLFQANELHYVMDQVRKVSPQVVPDARVRARLELSGTWSESLGEWSLPLAENDNINQWLGVIDSWVGNLVGSLNSLRSAALEELLLAETLVARMARAGGDVEQAPSPSQAPRHYPVLLPGSERKRQTRLGWWARFQRAEGLLPGSARLLAAGAIVAAVLSASSFDEGHGTSVFTDSPALMIYNGLGVAVVVDVDGHKRQVAAGTAGPLALPAFGTHHVETRTTDGRLIESFDAEARKGGHPVYNVAAATPLVEWTATYGNAAQKPMRQLGAVRWLDSTADHVLTEPPQSLSGRGGGGTLTVLDGAAKHDPGTQLALVDGDQERQRIAMLHARWDSSASPAIEQWIEVASAAPGFAELLAERVANAPADVLLRREQFDRAAAAAQPALCAQAGARAAAAPADGDLAYLALRCQPDSATLRDLQRQALARWPTNGWLLNAVGWDKLESPDWRSAAPELERAMLALPARAPRLALDIARIRRYDNPNADLSTLMGHSAMLRSLVSFEPGKGQPDSAEQAYAALASGAAANALMHTGGASEREAHLLRLVAASDGADPALVARALALAPEHGMDAPGAWLMLALAVKAGQDTAVRRELALKAGGRYGKQMLAFFDTIRKGGDPRAAERLLDKVHPEERAHAFSAALVLAGTRAPAAWRDYVRRMLFVAERPYFR